MIPAWMKDGLCYGSNLDFFPSKGVNIKDHRDMCRECPVRRDCAAFAIWGPPDYEDLYDHGVWGGLSVNERKAIRRGHADLDEMLASS